MDLTFKTTSLDEYGNERDLKGYESFITQVMNILMNEPGFIPDKPWLGVGLKTKKHILTNDNTKISKMKNEIQDQLTKVFPDLSISVMLTPNQHLNGAYYMSVIIQEEKLQMTTEIKLQKEKQPIINVKFKEFNDQ